MVSSIVIICKVLGTLKVWVVHLLLLLIFLLSNNICRRNLPRLIGREFFVILSLHSTLLLHHLHLCMLSSSKVVCSCIVIIIFVVLFPFKFVDACRSQLTLQKRVKVLELRVQVPIVAQLDMFCEAHGQTYFELIHELFERGHHLCRPRTKFSPSICRLFKLFLISHRLICHV